MLCLVEMHTANARNVIALKTFVFCVFSKRNVPQIFNPVVAAVSISMINGLIRVFAVMYCPRDTMSKHLKPKHHSFFVTPALSNKSCLSRKSSVPRCAFHIGRFFIAVESVGCSGIPEQFPTLRVIAQQLAQQFR